MLRPLAALSLLACASAWASEPAVPSWLEADSACAVHSRLLYDFPFTVDEGVELLARKYPGFNADSLHAAAAARYLETMVIDGTERVHRKAVRNIGLLDPARNGGWRHRGWDASPLRIAFVDSIISFTDGTLPDGGSHYVKYRFTIDVPSHPSLLGDTLRVWMPFPMETPRQSGVRLLSASHPGYVISDPGASCHSTIYFEAPVEADTAHFEYVAEFIASGLYYSPEFIRANIKAYDTSSPEYTRYTSFSGIHYERLDSLAAEIVGGVTDPYEQSELVYDYIIHHFPWAGAREYSTIPNIPLYVLDQRHGDCGQVALLYISLMRTLGVPARWESGWMLHPGEKNLHDWAEVYFEGVGWVPVDVSFGRYTSSADPAVQRFYSTGIDSYRLVANCGVCGEFCPPKRFIRSETVDSQMGEVECGKGNLFYGGWDQHLEILEMTPR